eukprot:TRINITY_DN2470_c0_g2_i1.p1 TRINITY_DN2470_c0_g2~~TRINITY_DN2470_c0_g2_i1.p1  ORF type:complete len:200 (-),score=32.36 TRINITY_DN2470_c0_g2_i1:584-1183(-)
MPLLTKSGSTLEGEPNIVKRMSAEEELLLCCEMGKCHQRFERVLRDRMPNVNWKGEDGMTPLHVACVAGASKLVARLMEKHADPSVPATTRLFTPLDFVLEKIELEEEQNSRLTNFDTVNRSDDTRRAIRSDINGWYACRDLLQAGGGVQGQCKGELREPNSGPDGSVNGGPPSELRAYLSTSEGSRVVCQGECEETTK